MNLLIIKEIARKKNISLVELAKRIGMTNPALHKMISENSTKVDTLEKIAEVLEVPITFFFQELSSQDLSLSGQLNELKEKLRKKEEEYAQLSKEIELNIEINENLRKRVAELEDSLKMSKTLMELYKKISNDNGLHALALQNPDVFKQILSPERLRQVELFDKEVDEMERITNLRFENGEIILPADDEIIEINFVQPDIRTPINKKEREMFIEALKKKYKKKSM